MNADEVGLIAAGAMIGFALCLATVACMAAAFAARRDPLAETIDDKAAQNLIERQQNERSQKFFAREGCQSGSPTKSEPGREPTPGISPTIRLVP